MFNIFNKIVPVLVSMVLVSCVEDVQADISPIQTNGSISGTLPVLYIETENNEPIVSKEIYLNATYRLDPMGSEDVEPLGTEADPLPMQIRGRGHSSWKGVKKPYKLKLGEKTAIMGMPKTNIGHCLNPLKIQLQVFK